jgi:peptide subunit release factor 1 (eRF1)
MRYSRIIDSDMDGRVRMECPVCTHTTDFEIKAVWVCPECGEENSYVPPFDQCAHGNLPEDCVACLEAVDHAFDAAREDRFFGRR